MKLPQLDWHKIHYTPSSGLLGFCLRLLSFPYKWINYLHRILYQYEIIKTLHLPGIVLSVGNITTGGTGKTPAVVMIAEWAKNYGLKAAVLSKGYGRKNQNKIIEVSDGKDVLATAEEAGDEPVLIANALINTPVIVSSSLHAAGMYAHKNFGANFFILDDGFQHIKLFRDLNIVLMDASYPFGNGMFLPAGPLREHPSGLERSDMLVFSRSFNNDANIPDGLKYYVQKRPVFYANHIAEAIVFGGSGKKETLYCLQNQRVLCFAGIANPESFFKMVEDLGVVITKTMVFPDHHNFTSEEIDKLLAFVYEKKTDIILTTEKDWVKLPASVKALPEVGFLKISFKFNYNETEFFSTIRKKINLKGIS